MKELSEPSEGMTRGAWVMSRPDFGNGMEDSPRQLSSADQESQSHGQQSVQQRGLQEMIMLVGSSAVYLMKYSLPPFRGIWGGWNGGPIMHWCNDKATIYSARKDCAGKNAQD